MGNVGCQDHKCQAHQPQACRDHPCGVLGLHHLSRTPPPWSQGSEGRTNCRPGSWLKGQGSLSPPTSELSHMLSRLNAPDPGSESALGPRELATKERLPRGPGKQPLGHHSGLRSSTSSPRAGQKGPGGEGMKRKARKGGQMGEVSV